MPREPSEVDVDLEVDEGNARTPAGDPPPTLYTGAGLITGLGTSSAVFDDPSDEVTIERRDLAAMPVPPDGDLPEPSDGPLPEAAPSLELGESMGVPDDAQDVLATLERHGIFEPPEAARAEWTSPKEVSRSGSRVRGAVIASWLIVLVSFGGGYFGWQQWIDYRHAQAATLVEQARAAAHEGDHARLVDAERLLRVARDKHARSTDIPRLSLFVQMQRVLEDGSHELGSLRAALARADQLGADKRYRDAARAVLAVFSGSAAELDKLLAQATESASGEAELLYVIGRLELRLGRPEAEGRLEAARAAAPDLLSPAVALAELAYERGKEGEALALFDAILKQQPGHMRVQLWRSYLDADNTDLAAGLALLQKQSDIARASAPVDRVLWSLSRARLLRRKGEVEPAQEAVRDALAGGANEPRLAALVAVEGERTGQLALAQQAASQAVAAAPGSSAYRMLLAKILIARHDGARALELLARVGDDPDVLLMRARAALQAATPEALQQGLSALEAFAQSDGDGGVEVQALQIRLGVQLEPTRNQLRDAMRLAREAPGDPNAARALGEVALALHDPTEAVRAFTQLTAASPDDAEAQYLLGRAQRMATDVELAEQAFRRALELSPAYTDAMVGLGGLLLDAGKYEEADALYQELAKLGGSMLYGRLGRVEALLGLGKVDDAEVQMQGLPEKQRDAASARETGAKLALARGKPGEAVTLLRPLTETGERRAATFALYGDALYAAEQVNAAAAAYEAALEIDGALPEGLIGRAMVHLRAERPDDALDLLEAAQQALRGRLRAPEVHAKVLTHIGHAYVQRDKRRDLEKANAVLQEATNIPRAPAEAFFWLGESLGGRRTPEATNAFKRYLELEPDGKYAARAKKALGPLL